ncbi:MAG: hypothetical protein M0C28_35880 [Candidatus Moduliflexus flocculans]|nr:hypothetical protein [Candidatus Moduliflexus flocculans]MCK7481955.1 hypothetical protein [Candidatus Moduliflexus flocculans]
MKRRATAAAAALALLLVAGVAPAQAQASFKVAVRDQGGRQEPGRRGVYGVQDGRRRARPAAGGDGQGDAGRGPRADRRADAALAAPQLVFDEVGDFAPVLHGIHHGLRPLRGLASRRGRLPGPRDQGRAQDQDRDGRAGQEIIARSAIISGPARTGTTP